MNLGTAMQWAVERYPHRRAVGGASPMTYAEWDAHTNRMARAMHTLGVRRGQRVALCLAGGEPQASLHLAVQKVGATAVPVSFRLSPAELAYCLDDAQPALVVTDESTSATANQALAQSSPVRRVESGHAGRDTIERLAQRQDDGRPDVRVSDQDLSVILYTSGTTGRPKGVPRTHSAEHYAALAHMIQSRHDRFEITLGVMPLFHTMGLRTLFASIIGAGTWVPQVRFDADAALELIVAERVSMLYLVPTMYWSLLHTGKLDEARTVRKLAYAGASMTPALATQLAETLAPESFVNHVGSTEIYTFTVGPDVISKPGSAGRAGAFSRVRLVDPSPEAQPHSIVGPGDQGQMAISMDSPEAFAGYWNRPDADAKAIRNGWYFPGDLAVTDDDGDLWINGRTDDMINSGGENIYPDEIEGALANCAAVNEVVVVGIEDDRWGQAATAFFVPHEDLAPDQALDTLRVFARESSGLPSLQRPKRFVAVDEVPKSAVGKILRRDLTAGNYWALADSAAEAPGETA